MSCLATAVIAEPHKATRARFREILEECRLRVVAEVADGQALLDAVRRLRPELVLVAIRLPKVSGLAAAEAIKREQPDARVFVASNTPDERYRRAAERAGADAFLVKSEAYETLIDAVAQWRGLSRADLLRRENDAPPT